MTKKDKNEKEIYVHAPDYIPKKAPILKDTTGTEALDVFKVTKTVNSIFSFAMLSIGTFITVIALFNIIGSLDLFVNPLFGGLLGFVGVINLLCGLLLLSKK